MEYFIDHIDRILPSCECCLKKNVRKLLYNSDSLDINVINNEEEKYYIPYYIHILPLQDGVWDCFVEYIPKKYEFLIIDTLSQSVYCITRQLMNYMTLFYTFTHKKNIPKEYDTDEHRDFFVSLIEVGILQVSKITADREQNCIECIKRICKTQGFILSTLLSKGKYRNIFFAIDNKKNKLFLKHFIGDYFSENKFLSVMNIFKKLGDKKFLPKLIYYDVKQKFYILEYIDGDNLENYIKSDISMEERIRIINNIVNIVKYFHRNCIVHGDLHIGQFIITPQKTLVLIDFDFAYDIHSRRASSVICGTFEYLAPETISNNPFYPIQRQQITLCEEVYNIGVLMYGILYGGTFPFYEFTWKQLYLSILNDVIIFPKFNCFGEQIPSELVNIMKKCLSKESVHRYHSAIDIPNI